MPGLPAADRLGDPVDVAEAEAAQRGRGGGRHLVDAAEVELRGDAGGLRQQVRHALEHIGVARAHPLQMEQQRGGEAGGVRIAHEDGEPLQLRRPLRQRVRLPVGDHLQPVLDGAQEPVGGGQLGRGAARDMPGAGQQAQRAERRGAAQGRIAAAPHQLQRLGEEFDLANPPLAQLDVVPGDPRHRIACIRQSANPRGREFMLVNPPLHGVDVGDRGEVQTAPPDEWPDRLQECRAQRQVAGHRARLDHRRALPVLPHAFVVGDGGRQCNDRRRHRRVRPQPQIGAEDIAVGVACLHKGD